MDQDLEQVKRKIIVLYISIADNSHSS